MTGTGTLLAPVELPEANGGQLFLEPLTEEDIIVDFSVLHHGMKEKDPLSLVRCYAKENKKCEMLLLDVI